MFTKKEVALLMTAAAVAILLAEFALKGIEHFTHGMPETIGGWVVLGIAAAAAVVAFSDIRERLQELAVPANQAKLAEAIGKTAGVGAFAGPLACILGLWDAGLVLHPLGILVGTMACEWRDAAQRRLDRSKIVSSI